MRLRRYRDSDRADVWDLHVATLKAAGYPMSVAEWDTDLHDIDGSYFARDGEFVVAENANRIVGVGGFLPTDKDSVEIKRMRVHPEMQRRGVGEKILRYLEDEAIRRGFTRSHLDTAHTKIQNFYLKSGYVFVRSEFEEPYEYFFFEKHLEV